MMNFSSVIVSLVEILSVRNVAALESADRARNEYLHAELLGCSRTLRVRRAARSGRSLLSVHSRCGLYTRTITKTVTVIRRLQTFRCLHACSGCFRLDHFAGWGLHPLESAAFSRRTPTTDI
jgi:hypothetical protein